MAADKKTAIPDYQEKQKLLYIKKASPETLLDIADQLIKEDRFNEAYDYIKSSGDETVLEKYMHDALERGDFFNFERAALELDLEIPPEMWNDVADNAYRKDMQLFAVEAYRRAGEKQKAEKIIETHPDLFGPVFEMERQKVAGKTDMIEEKSRGDTDKEPAAEENRDRESKPPKKKKKKKKRR